MKKFFALILALVMALSLVACGEKAPASDDGAADKAPTATKMRFVTGGESGTYYAFGGTIAQHATNNAGIEVIGGAEGNVREVVEALLAGTLQVRQNFHCNHHHHGEGHNCGSHSCGNGSCSH